MEAESVARFRPRVVQQIATGVLYCEHTGRMHDLYYEPGLAALLASWDGFDTVDDVLLSHIGVTNFQRAARDIRICGRGPEASALARCVAWMLNRIHRQQMASLAARPAFIRLQAVLDDLVHERLLASEEDMLLAAAGGASSADAPTIDFIGIVTHDDPAQLKHCVRSYLESAQHHERTMEVVVIDLSHDEASSAANRQMLASAGREYGQRVSYIDRHRIRELAAALVRAGLPPEDVELALNGHGSNAWPQYAHGLNVLLLHTAGASCLIADDGSTCTPISHPESQRSLLVTQEPAHQRGLVADRDGATQRNGETDLVGLHEGVLGRSFSTLIESFRSSPGARLGRLCDHLVTAFSSPLARVVVSATGSVEAAPSRLSGYPSSPDPDGCRLLEVDFDQRKKPSPRSMLTATRQYVLSHSHDTSGKGFAVDNREPLPPFVASRADCMRTFRALAARLVPDAYFMDIPWALPCRAAGLTGGHGEPEPSSGSLPFSATLSASLALAGQAAEVGDFSTRARRAGNRLAEAAAIPTAAFAEQFHPHLCRSVREDVLKWRSLSRDCTDPHIAPPAHAAATAARFAMATDAAMMRLQKQTEELGRLVRTWPDMVTETKTLQRTGLSIAVRL